MAKIIDIRKYLPQEPEDKEDYIDAAMALLDQIDQDSAGIITKGIINYILLEVEIGLGLRSHPEDNSELHFYPQISNCYRLAGLRAIFEVEDCENWKPIDPRMGKHCYNCANRDGNPYRAQPDENCMNYAPV